MKSRYKTSLKVMMGLSDQQSEVAGEPLALQPLVSNERNRSLTFSDGMALATTHGWQVEGKRACQGLVCHLAGPGLNSH